MFLWQPFKNHCSTNCWNVFLIVIVGCVGSTEQTLKKYMYMVKSFLENHLILNKQLNHFKRIVTQNRWTDIESCTRHGKPGTTYYLTDLFNHLKRYFSLNAPRPAIWAICLDCYSWISHSATYSCSGISNPCHHVVWLLFLLCNCVPRDFLVCPPWLHCTAIKSWL